MGPPAPGSTRFAPTVFMKPLVALLAAAAATLGASAGVLTPNIAPAGNVMHSHFGILPLPHTAADIALAKSPPCLTFTAACALEAAGDLPAALEYYESRMSTCGMAGWARIGMLGAGHTSSVSLRITPCGTRLAAKSPQVSVPHSVEQVVQVHRVLELLQGRVGKKGTPCHSCFPIPLYLSNLTGVSYQEYAPSISLGKYISRLNVTTPPGVHELKRTMREMLEVLAVFKPLAVRHNDLSFRNSFVRVPEANESVRDGYEPRVMVMDFGSAVPQPEGAQDCRARPPVGPAHDVTSFTGYLV